MKHPEFEENNYLGSFRKLTLPDGRRWLGDESSGMSENDQRQADPRPPLDVKQRSYYDLYGGGKPNTEM
ncbi:hypothetical protein HYS95_03570 [Candidatus Daviesbacteria bacterium]|nr:hypothetical protein [Candidatus Daviesbacteria bacterium]